VDLVDTMGGVDLVEADAHHSILVAGDTNHDVL